ncbi:MAG: NAD-dependent epimerase/dehydratase family protein [Anaerolineales bacterium]|nr:NAD-dependent epimerase/dehydratase family protein [Anaerolineales bacterium]
MRALVTGGTGFLGSALIRELLARGYAVTALVRTFERAQRLPRGVRAIPADITRPDSFRHALRGVDVVFHLAAVTGVGIKPKDRPRVQRINVEGTRHVLGLAAAEGVRCIVHVSTVAVYGDTHGQCVSEAYRPNEPAFQSEAQRTKHIAHFEIAEPMQRSGAPLIIACPGTLYGPGELAPFHRLLRLQARGRLLLMLGPDNARSWTHVEDAARGLRLLAEAGRTGETYHLCGPAHTFREFFAASARAARVSAPLLWLPSSLARTLAQLLEGPLPHLAEQFRTWGGVTYLACSAKAQSELGWHVRPLEEVITFV